MAMLTMVLVFVDGPPPAPATAAAAVRVAVGSVGEAVTVGSGGGDGTRVPVGKARMSPFVPVWASWGSLKGGGRSEKVGGRAMLSELKRSAD